MPGGFIDFPDAVDEFATGTSDTRHADLDRSHVPRLTCAEALSDTNGAVGIARVAFEWMLVRGTGGNSKDGEIVVINIRCDGTADGCPD